MVAVCGQHPTTDEARRFISLRQLQWWKCLRPYDSELLRVCDCQHRSPLWSANMQRYRLQQCFNPVPGDLHTDTNQEKGRQLRDHRHPRWSEDSRQPVGKSIAEQNADRDECQPNECSQDCQRVICVMV